MKKDWKKYVIETRERLGLTQQEFARLLGVSVPSVQRWEYGKTKPPLLQADIINQINDRMNAIKLEEQRRKAHIGDLLRAVLIGGGVAYGMYKLFEILFDQSNQKDD